MTSRPPSGPGPDAAGLEPYPQGSRQVHSTTDSPAPKSTTLYVKGRLRPAGRSFAGWFAWTHTLRWRLFLTYFGTLVVLLGVLGIVLNVIVGSVLSQEERDRFTAQVLANVTVNQRFFDQEVSGTQATCIGATSYQQAFEDTIAEPLKRGFPAITAVYLLDRNGSVLAPGSASGALGTEPPYFDRADLTLIQRKIAVARQQATGSRLYCQRLLRDY